MGRSVTQHHCCSTLIVVYEADVHSVVSAGTSLTKRNMALNIMSHQTNKYIEAVCNDSDVLDRMLSYLQISNITD